MRSKSLLIVLASLVAVTSAQNTRSLTLKNSCKDPVHVGFTGGATLPCSSGCGKGQVCNEANGMCFWDLPLTASQRVLAPGASVVAALSAPHVNVHSSQQRISGTLYASTGCSTVSVGPTNATACDTGICNNGTCSAYSGPTGPLTSAEFTLQDNATDFFDITLIQGFNLPISMTPNPGQTFAPPSDYGIQGNGVDYWCQSAGGRTQPASSHLTGCTWDFTPPPSLAPSVTFVSTKNDTARSVGSCQTATTCTSTCDCTVLGEVCGMAAGLNPFGEATPALCMTCGRPVGYWNANEICTWSAGQPFNGEPFECNQGVGQGNGPDTRAALYGCAGSLYGQSCFQPGAADTCCGCADWESMGISAPPVTQCNNTNPTWSKIALPFISWMKAACPTAYTYAYDDVTSTFTCSTAFRTEIVDMVPKASTDTSFFMKKQMIAERHRRSEFIQAEGSKAAMRLQSEGTRLVKFNMGVAEQEATRKRSEGEADAKVKLAVAEKTAFNLLATTLQSDGCSQSAYMVTKAFVDLFSDLAVGASSKVLFLPYDISSISGIVNDLPKLFGRHAVARSASSGGGAGGGAGAGAGSGAGAGAGASSSASDDPFAALN